MKKFILPLFFIAATAMAQLGTTRQLIVSVGAEWNSTQGTMMLLEKKGGAWKLASPPWNVVYGASGMAWGIGVNKLPAGTRVKKEGDGCAPAGIFELGTLLGYAPAAPTGVKYPYVQSTSTTRWVDDTASVYYNKMIDEKNVPMEAKGNVQWRSAEKMKLNGIDYKYVIFVKHNAAGIPGKGSAIFIHLNNKERTPTAGCTAMDENDMLTLLHWIDAKKAPLLVQLPRTEYDAAMKQWGLPPLP